MDSKGSGRGPDTQKRMRARALRDSGLPLAQVAAELGITRQAVHHLTGPRARGTRVWLRCSACGRNLGASGPRGMEGLCLPCLGTRPDAPFPVRLRAHRLAARLSQAELARGAGVSETTVATLERGERPPLPRTVGRLAEALGVGAGELEPRRGEGA